MLRSTIVNNIFDEMLTFKEKAQQVFQYQYNNNEVYRQWNDLLKPGDITIDSLTDIFFLPVSFFKTHKVTTGMFEPQYIFESSGTTQTSTSRHYVNQAALYHTSFTETFKLFYGDIKNFCILGLLPSYLERKNSSLVVMVNELIRQSQHPLSGFYLDEFSKLHTTLQQLEESKQQTLLIGVTFALLDFAEQFPIQLKYTSVMETGGMKGRRKELTRVEVHQKLCNSFNLQQVHSEYGMTEMLSQAYAKKDGLFYCPPWMKVLVRDEEEPLAVKETGRGVLNIIDLANIDSCSFIATDDVGIVHADGSFEVHGRIDYSDIRGCSLLAV